ncbi:hypothetical protein R1flu_002707 [Riccia fluitans]|uniref:Uncharacterized protein n=1 Tax=Riccia fluitans TaxID=41844 RepID=A0ABD1YA94_9MARC
MAARKLHMSGAQDRIRVGAGAVAEGVAQNGHNVCILPAVESMYESRLASPIMQPVPLAARFGGPKHDSLRPASTALQSTWIQRLRPASPEVPCSELGHKVAHVWKDPEPPLWNSKTPLLLTAPSKEPLHQPVSTDSQQEQNEADGGGDVRLIVEEKAGPSKTFPRNIDLNDKGKGRLQVQGPPTQEMTMTAGQLKNDNSRSAEVQAVQPPKFSGYYSRDYIAGEGYPRRQGVDTTPEENDVVSKGTHPNAESKAVVTGFGSLRVILKTPLGNPVNKTVGSTSKLKGLMEGVEAADFPLAANHYIADSDRNRVAPFSGPQVPTTPVHPGSNIQHIGGAQDSIMEIVERRIARPGEVLGGGQYPYLQRTGYGTDNCRPFTLHQSYIPCQDSVFGYPDYSKGNRSPGGFFPVSEDRPMGPSMKGWYPTFSAMGSGVDRGSKGTAATQSFGPILAEDGKIRYAYRQEVNHHNWAAAETRGKDAYVPNGLEAQTRDVAAAVKCYADVGSSQQHGSQLSPPFAPYQSPSNISCGKQSSPLHARSPPSRVEDEARIGNGSGDAHQGHPGETSSFPLPSAPPKPRRDAAEGMSAKPPWSFLFAAYKLSNQPGEPPNSNSSTGTLPLDGYPRANEGQNHGNNASSGPRESGNQDYESGGSARAGMHAAASSAEARSLFDNQSSHFSSSPWPVDDGHNPTDDAGSAFHSQASLTPSMQVPVSHGPSYGQGQGNSRHKYDASVSSMGGARDVSYKQAKNGAHPESLSFGLRNSTGRTQGGQRSTDEEDHAIESSKTSGRIPVPSFSGRKDDTNGASPPLPWGCYIGSDVRSPAFPGGALEDRGKSTALHLRTPNLNSEPDGIHLGKRQQGRTSALRGLHASKRQNCEQQAQIDLAQPSKPRGSDAGLRRDVEMHEAEPMTGDMFREVGGKMARPNGIGDFGHKQSRQRDPNDVGEAGTSKRSRHHPSERLANFQGGGSGGQPTERENGAATGRPSSWLTRWVSSKSTISGTGAGVNPQTAAGSKDGRWNGCGPSVAADGRPSGAGGFTGARGFQGSNIGEWVGRKDENGSDWNNTRDLSSKRAVFGLPPFTTASAAAIALTGTATRKQGPVLAQRIGPIALWPPVQMETTQNPGPQKSRKKGQGVISFLRYIYSTQQSHQDLSKMVALEKTLDWLSGSVSYRAMHLCCDTVPV